MMRIVFMGSGELACPALERLLERNDLEVVAVVSQPDRPKGRNRHIAPCPTKAFAETQGLHLMTPEKIGAAEPFAEITALEPDLIVVAAYGQYIPTKILKLPPHEAINIHPSLLPKYRGASPIQWALANGETVTGCTILYVSKEMDAGDIISQEEMKIEPEDTVVTLKPRLAERGAVLLLQAIDAIREGTVQRTPQVESEATYVSKLTKEDGRIDWSMSASTLECRCRGFYPWPSCYCEAPAGTHTMLKVIHGQVEEGSAPPGEILDVKGEGPLVATGEGALRLVEVQPPGKKSMTGRAFLNGHRLSVGDRMG